MEDTLITILELAHAIGELPVCHKCPESLISVPLPKAGLGVIKTDYERPTEIHFRKVIVDEGCGVRMRRWALADQELILV